MANLVLAWIDCEFGGLDVEKHDLTEVAIILTDSRLVEIEAAEWKVRARPERVSAEAAAIFGYDKEIWDKAPGIRQVLTELVEMLPKRAKVMPAGQNVRMDVIFLERAFRNCEMDYPFDYHVIDLATLFYSWSLVSGEEPSALSLRQAAQTAGLLNGAVEHRAMADTRLTLETFRHFIGALAPKPPA
ncbi:MAG: 3'-5' exonuclease [Myxococcales bacterium]|nr:3'-5' exonuclease [Myxococcales bacterium]